MTWSDSESSLFAVWIEEGVIRGRDTLWSLVSESRPGSTTVWREAKWDIKIGKIGNFFRHRICV